MSGLSSNTRFSQDIFLLPLCSHANHNPSMTDRIRPRPIYRHILEVDSYKSRNVTVIQTIMSIILYIIMATGLLLTSSLEQHLSYADSLKNSISQRIGNYDMEMKTDPAIPIAGQNTKILLRISSINGEE